MTDRAMTPEKWEAIRQEGLKRTAEEVAGIFRGLDGRMPDSWGDLGGEEKDQFFQNNNKLKNPVEKKEI